MAQWDKVLKIQLMIFVMMMVILSLGLYGAKGGIFTVVAGGENRIYGPEGTFIEGNNEIGLAIIAIPLMRYLQVSSRHRGVRIGLAIVMVLCAVSVLGTHSRGAARWAPLR